RCSYRADTGSQIDVTLENKLARKVHIRSDWLRPAQCCPNAATTGRFVGNSRQYLRPQSNSVDIVHGEALGKLTTKLLVLLQPTHLVTADAALGEPAAMICCRSSLRSLCQFLVLQLPGYIAGHNPGSTRAPGDTDAIGAVLTRTARRFISPSARYSKSSNLHMPLERLFYRDDLGPVGEKWGFAG
ncbi:MAG: hypothetical protein WB678_11875, partial [Stellaceae bacterium]